MSNSCFEQYIAQVDLIKKAKCKPISNIYEDINSIKVMCKAKQANVFSTPNCILLFTLKHNIFYECWYFAEDIIALEATFHLFLKTYTKTLPIRFMVVGKDENTLHICEALNTIGCTLKASLSRLLSCMNDTMVKALQDEYSADIVEVANPDDAQEIFDMLKSEFDLYADNIPEFVEVKENIDKQQVFIIRKDNKIALLHYFTVKNNILYGYYDLVRKEYRNEQLYFSLILFIYNYIAKNNIKRRYEWRNITKKRLAKIPIANINEKATIYINFYLYNPECNSIN